MDKMDGTSLDIIHICIILFFVPSITIYINYLNVKRTKLIYQLLTYSKILCGGLLLQILKICSSQLRNDGCI